MGKAFGLVLIVVGLWVGLEVYTKGTHGAFGGLLAGDSAPVQEEQQAPMNALRQGLAQDVETNMRMRERALGDDSH
jgi:hypothetical protein